LNTSHHKEQHMHVVITGASSGIGACLAREFHANGAEVTIVARRSGLLEQLKKDLGSRCEVVVADLASKDGADWVHGVEARAPIDVFVNNAGFNISGPFDAATSSEVAKLFQVDLQAPIALARAVVPAMIARGSGALVNISSVAGIVPPAGMACYAAAKAGLAAFSEALRAELKPSGVHVLTVYPGPIDNGTPQDNVEMYGSAAKAAPWGDPRELACEIRLAMQRRRARLIFPRFYAAARAFPQIARWVVDGNTPVIKRLPAGALGAGQT
jgi:short-subunit dehydrogenase